MKNLMVFLSILPIIFIVFIIGISTEKICKSLDKQQHFTVYETQENLNVKCCWLTTANNEKIVESFKRYEDIVSFDELNNFEIDNVIYYQYEFCAPVESILSIYKAIENDI